MITLYILPPKPKQIFSISSSTLFLLLKNPYHSLALPKWRVEDLNKACGLPSDTIPDTLQDTATTMPEISILQNGLLKLLKNLKPSKAAGPDTLKPVLLRELREEITPIIKIIFDRSLQIGKLPAGWLKANVMPAFKKGDKSLAANYRLISLTCILCKVLEHILASNIGKHLDGQGILNDLQHGFRGK